MCLINLTNNFILVLFRKVNPEFYPKKQLIFKIYSISSLVDTIAYKPSKLYGSLLAIWAALLNPKFDASKSLNVNTYTPLIQLEWAISIEWETYKFEGWNFGSSKQTFSVITLNLLNLSPISPRYFKMVLIV